MKATEKRNTKEVYAIRVRRYFYGAIPSTVGYYCDPMGHVITYKSRAEARQEIKKLDNQVYYMSSGECARPMYTVRKETV
jgi:hypothetical protein